MIRVSNLNKSYGGQLLFEDVTFSMLPGERLGVVGRNGHGKSTLFKMIIGEEHQDSGEISVPRGYRIGHLSQHLRFTEESVLAEVVLALPELEGGWKEDYKAREMLHGLGFSDQEMARAPSLFSGGFQIRMNLAKLLLSEPNLLLLDEPTNYLDVVAVRWLGRFLRNWSGELMIITHDREFMDSVTTHTMAIHRQRVKRLEGGTEKLYAQILQEEEIYEKTRINLDKQRRHIEKFVERFRAKASKARAVQSRVKQLEKMESLGELGEIDTLDFRFREREFAGRFLGHVRGVTFGYDADTPPLIQDLSFSIGKGERIAVVGPNGRGKTTLLSLLAGELSPVDGEVSFSSNTVVSYFGQTNVSRLDHSIAIEKELMNAHPEHNRGIARSVAGLMMFEGDAALKRIGVLSGGERSRVLLGRILLTPTNLLLLDEPTNHLDMDSIESLLEAIEQFSGAVVIVSHSEEILKQIATRLIVFDRGGVTVFDGGYEDFLARVGWEGEESEEIGAGGGHSGRVDVSGGAKNGAGSKKANKENRKQARRCEQRITALEARGKELEHQMLAAVEARDSWKIASLGQERSEVDAEIEKLFLELEQLEENS